MSLSPSGSVINSVGQARTFRALYSDPNGYSNIRFAFLQVKSGSSGVLRARYDLLTNQLSLLNDAGTGYSAGVPLGTDRILTNRQGSLSCKLTKVAASGNSLQIDWVVAAGSALAGSSHPVLLLVQDRGNLTDGLDLSATWQIASQ